MNANPILLQKKYARVVELFAEENYLSLDDAFAFFYKSKVYELMREGSSDMHCMSEQYLSKDLMEEYGMKNEVSGYEK